ncbi:MAG: hypothetical protein WBD72_12730 [Candidatus Acidiferrum sp.]
MSTAIFGFPDAKKFIDWVVRGMRMQAGGVELVEVCFFYRGFDDAFDDGFDVEVGEFALLSPQACQM